MAAVVAFVDDLMFFSRIREAASALGLDVRRASSVAALLEACRDSPRAVFVDLDSARLPVDEALAALKTGPSLGQAPVVGFFSHVHAQRARQGREAGCTRVLPRSVFVEELPTIVREALRG